MIYPHEHWCHDLSSAGIDRRRQWQALQDRISARTCVSEYEFAVLGVGGMAIHAHTPVFWCAGLLRQVTRLDRREEYRKSRIERDFRTGRIVIYEPGRTWPAYIEAIDGRFYRIARWPAFFRPVRRPEEQ